MALESGTRLAHYEVVSSLGAGGMGEVYRAKDTKLGREVAIKVLPEGFADEPERIARFEREAKVLASLNHPNIATLYGFEKDGDTSFLVMELVEGETLAGRIEKGAIPIDEVLPLFLQIAEGLEIAHENGVIHRDLKPANIKIVGSATEAGRVKILDFGLAKQALEGSQAGVDPEAPTEEVMTQAGQSLGTPAYMAPEQVSAQPAGRAADVWAFGVCLYEALTGLRPFVGAHRMELFSQILSSDPDWGALPEATPAQLRRLLQRCLRKPIKQRMRDIRDARLELEEIRPGEVGGSASPIAPVPTQTQGVPAWLAIAGAAALTIAALWGWLAPREADERQELVRRFEIDLGQTFALLDWSVDVNMALSPDGSRMVYSMKTEEGPPPHLYLRDLDGLEPKRLEGTLYGVLPVFSPDGEWIAYHHMDYTLAPGEGDAGPYRGPYEIRKVSVRGGAPRKIADAFPPRGLAWLPEGRIVFGAARPHVVEEGVDHPADSYGLFEVSDSGGDATRLTTGFDSFPQALPGSPSLLFTREMPSSDDRAEWSLMILDRDSGEIRMVVRDAAVGRFVDTGHLVFMRADSLWAVPFDLDSLSIAGREVPVVSDLQWMTNPQIVPPYEVGEDGSLILLPRASVQRPEYRLLWLDQEGGREPLPLPPIPRLARPMVSPDGRHVAYISFLQGEELEVWVHDRSRPGSRVRLVPGVDATSPVWSFDSRGLYYADREEDPVSGAPTATIRRIGLEGGRAEEIDIPYGQSFPGHSGLDGELFVTVANPETGLDLGVVDRGVYRDLLRTAADEARPTISPNGRWLAYRSNESGSWEVQVRPYPDLEGGRWQVSVGGGREPRWSPDGRRLYYRNERFIYAVDLSVGEAFVPSSPIEWIELGPPIRTFWGADWDLEYPDGKRVLAMERIESHEQRTRLVFVENWTEELKRLAPAD